MESFFNIKIDKKRYQTFPITEIFRRKSENGKWKFDFVKKDVYNAKIKNIEDKVLDTTNLATSTLNAEINEVKGEIASITNLATSATLTAVENKIPNVSNSVKKIDYNT